MKKNLKIIKYVINNKIIIIKKYKSDNFQEKSSKRKKKNKKKIREYIEDLAYRRVASHKIKFEIM